ncbi:MAG: TonB-dependent receptor [Bacteroidota bacterium]
MQKYIKMFYILSLIFCSICNSYVAEGQITVTGKVTGEGEALLGATISVEGENKGVVADVNGSYRVESLTPESILVFSFVGFVSQTVKVGNQTVIDIDLEPDLETLGEVIVVGYGTIQRSDLTGAVSSIKSEDLNVGAIQSVQQSLQGRIAGVQISQTSAEPGGGLNIRVRGSGSINGGTQPLYVIDGVPINNANLLGSQSAGIPQDNNASNPLASISPDDIASIEVLKDASATAIYGARGANGVVMITTKRGFEGKGKISIDHYTGVQSVLEQPDILTTQEYIDFQNAVNPGYIAGKNTEEIGDTDWLDLVTRDAVVTNTNVSFSGGNESSKYFISGGYFLQEGIIENTSSERYSFRINLDNKINERVRTNLSLTTSLLVNNPATEGAGQDDRGPFSNAFQFDPTINPRNADGTINVDQNDPFLGDFLNPLAFIEGQDINANTNRTFGAFDVSYDIFRNLTAKAKIGIDRQFGRREILIDSIALLNVNNIIAQIFEQERTSTLLEITLNYNKSFKNFNLDLVGGTTFEEFNVRDVTAKGEGFVTLDQSLYAIGAGDDELSNLGSSRQTSRLFSNFFRAQSSIKDKILVTGSLRVDGSSRFGRNNKYGFFPSGAVGYKLHEESFIPKFFDQFKVRASYGVSGNQPNLNYLSLDLYRLRELTLDSAEVIFPEQIRLANPDLQWETTNQLNIGIDFAVFKTRLMGTIEYYHKNTQNLLFQGRLPGSSGTTNSWFNSGRLVNSGFELTLSTINVDKSDFVWTTDLQFTTLHNEVKELDGISGNRIRTGGGISGGNFILTEPGLPIGSYYVFETDGVYQSQEEIDNTPHADANDTVGSLKFKDNNENGRLDDGDRVVAGNPLPDFTFGIRNSFKYKGVSLDIFIDGQFGAELANANLARSIYPQQPTRNRFAFVVDDRWTPENTGATYPSLVGAPRNANVVLNDLAIEDASFVRIQSIRLGYRIPVKSNTIGSLNVYLLGQNLLYFTEYTGLNPEANVNGGNQLNVLDINPYPLARTFMAGFNITF